MFRKLLMTAAIVLPTVVHGQYCISGGPSSIIDSNVETVLLNGENNSSINYTGCPGVTGVQDLTSYQVYLTAGSFYTVDIRFSTCGNNYTGVGEAWIDFNQDAVFDSTESIGTWSGIPPTVMSTFPFTVPGGAPTGITRMRVIQYEGGTLPINPCASFAWGSVMDFGIYIQNGINCGNYQGNTVTSPIVIPAIPFNDTGSTALCYTSNSDIYPSPDVFYRMILDGISPTVKVSLCGSDFDTYLTIFDSQFSPVYFNDDATNCGVQSEIEMPAMGYDTLYIAVEGWGYDTGTYVLDVSYPLSSGTRYKLNDHVLTYPNPAKGTFMLKGIRASSVIIKNSEGQFVKEAPVIGHTVDVHGLAPGLYIVNIRAENRVFYSKLVIK